MTGALTNIFADGITQSCRGFVYIYSGMKCKTSIDFTSWVIYWCVLNIHSRWNWWWNEWYVNLQWHKPHSHWRFCADRLCLFYKIGSLICHVYSHVCVLSVFWHIALISMTLGIYIMLLKVIRSLYLVIPLFRLWPRRITERDRTFMS